RMVGILAYPEGAQGFNPANNPPTEDRASAPGLSQRHPPPATADNSAFAVACSFYLSFPKGICFCICRCLSLLVILSAEPGSPASLLAGVEAKNPRICPLPLPVLPLPLTPYPCFSCQPPRPPNISITDTPPTTYVRKIVGILVSLHPV